MAACRSIGRTLLPFFLGICSLAQEVPQHPGRTSFTTPEEVSAQ